MEAIQTLLNFILHIDDQLKILINDYHNWIYLILFLIIFVETGIVLFPFLPGDSLLFAAGILVPDTILEIYILIPVCLLAAILGNTSNYIIGRYLGERALKIKFRGKPMVKPEYLERTHVFYEKYGPITLVITRFIPIIRTISPFVAGVGKMSYGKFTLYNIIGAFLWVIPFTVAGYLLGQNEFVKKYFEFIALGIILLSVLPIFFALFKRKFQKNKT
ncbi:MAG: VTT domain-containing protein [Chitinophagales bacterium]|nr:VTT domain-containing protein [Chitinophagales bacterium]